MVTGVHESRIRCRSREKPARPYICCSIILKVTWNLTGVIIYPRYNHGLGRWLERHDGADGEVAGARPARAGGGVAADLDGPRSGAGDDRRLHLRTVICGQHATGSSRWHCCIRGRQQILTAALPVAGPFIAAAGCPLPYWSRYVSTPGRRSTMKIACGRRCRGLAGRVDRQLRSTGRTPSQASTALVILTTPPEAGRESFSTFQYHSLVVIVTAHIRYTILRVGPDVRARVRCRVLTHVLTRQSWPSDRAGGGLSYV